MVEEGVIKSGSLPKAKRRGIHLPENWDLMLLSFVPVLTGLAFFIGIAIERIPSHEVVTINRMTWSRSVDICEIRPVRHEGWELPEGATLVAAEKRAYQYIRRQHEFRGTPIYADWYTYDMDELTRVSGVTSTGEKGDEMKWPEPELSEGQVLGERSETLTLWSDGGKGYEVDGETWEQVDVGDTVGLDVSREGEVVGMLPVDGGK